MSGLSDAALDAVLREVIETLAAVERGDGSPGERQAAEWLAARLRRAGAEAVVEDAAYRPGFAAQLMPLGVIGFAAGAAALAGRGRAGPAVVAAASSMAVADDAANGKRWWRRLVARPRTTANVVATVGDPKADRTLVVLAHHDAAHTGAVFDQRFQRMLARRFPRSLARIDTSMPLWWPVAGAGMVTAAGAASGRRGVTVAGMALCALITAAGADLARGAIVPGANDNLSGCAGLVAVAEGLAARPVSGLRVVLASCGAEEVLQGGIYPFVERHLEPLDRERTWVLNLETIGSPALILIEGEGTFGIRDYPGVPFRDAVARAAAAHGIGLYRGCRARSSTDSVVVARRGFPTATLSSWEPETKLLSNYHLPTDVPDNLRWDVVAAGARLAEAVARDLAAA
jgi:Peptidase family M28